MNIDQRWRLRPHIGLAFLRPNKAILVSDRAMAIPNLTESLCQALRMLKDGCVLSDLYGIADCESIDALLVALKKKNLIIHDYGISYAGSTYERQIHYFAELVNNPVAAQERLRSARVMVVGVGGVGAISIQHLLAAGVQRFILIDSDYVEASNFNRQFGYHHADIGRPKVEAMAASMQTVVPHVEVLTHITRIGSSQDLHRCARESNQAKKCINFVLCCADQPIYAIQRFITTFCRQHGAACSFAGVGYRSGHFGPLLTNHEMFEAYEEHLCKLEMFWENTEMAPMPLSIGFTNTLISTMFIRDVIHHLAGLPDGPSVGCYCEF